MRIDKIRIFHRVAALVISLTCCFTGPRVARAQVFSNGDVFVAVGKSQVLWYSGNGTLIKTLVAPIAGNIRTAGMAFDSSTNLYVTMFDSQAVAVFNNAGVFKSNFGSGYDSNCESIVIDSIGDVYVGQQAGARQILKFNSAGVLEQRFTVATEAGGSDWIDLGDDLCTMYYTSEGPDVKVYDVCTDQQLPNLNTVPLPGPVAQAHRQLLNGDTLVANSNQIVRLDDTGAVIQTYTALGESNLFAVNIDPNGTNFWSADQTTGDVLKFDLASGNVLEQFSATGGNSNLVVGGLAVFGEITAASALRTGVCATRTSRFWFTHAYSTDPTCATLQAALAANVGGINLGFTRLPFTYENADPTLDVNDALQEALGLYWKSDGRTGESGGSQNEGLPASSLCVQRKLLSIELISATANVRLLGTDPSDCTYVSGGVTTNFPANLLEQARTALEGFDTTVIMSMTALLQKFNRGGQANDFPPGLVECSPNTTGFLRSIARDPTRQGTCPGVNYSCATAETVFFPVTPSNPFAAFSNAVFSRSVNLRSYLSVNAITSSSSSSNSTPVNSCTMASGPYAIWQIPPSVGGNGRQFTVSTSGSNFDTLIAAFSGSCSNLTQVDCVNQFLSTEGETLSFTTDGTDTFYVVGEGGQGGYGILKIRITSP
jgi:hypothetical protein